MSLNRRIVVLMIAVMLLGAGIALAQTTAFEVKRGTVISVWGNHLVVRLADGTLKDAEVPGDFLFDVDGKMLTVSALEPGMKLTQVVTTTTTPVEVKTTEVKRGEVMGTSGRTVIIRSQKEGTKKFTVPSDFPFWVDGEKKTVYDLRKGMRVTAHIVHTHVEIVTDQHTQVAAAGAPATRRAPAAKRAPAPVAPAPMVLPKTGSLLPLAGMAGIGLLLLGIGIGVVRRI